MFISVGNLKIAIVPTIVWVVGLAILVASGMWLAILLVVVGAFGFAAVSYWPEEVRENAPYLAIVGWFGCVIGLTNTTGSQAFFTAAAQVLPVLFIAMIVGRRFSLVGREEPDRRVRIILMYALVLGEVFSLDALASGKEGNQAFGIVVGALVIAAISLIAEVIGEPPQETSVASETPEPPPSTGSSSSDPNVGEREVGEDDASSLGSGATRSKLPEERSANGLDSLAMAGKGSIEVGQRRAFLKDGGRVEGEVIDIGGRRIDGGGVDTGWVKFKLDDGSIEMVKPSAIPLD